MAIEYDFFLSTGLGRTQVLEIFAGQMGGLTWVEGHSSLFDTAIEINVSEPLKGRLEAIGEGFGFIPTLRIGFRRRAVSESDYDRFEQLIFQATMLLLEHARDAVLLFNGELIVFQRLGGRLTFNSDYELWDEDWLKNRLTIPVDRRPLPSPLV